MIDLDHTAVFVMTPDDAKTILWARDEVRETAKQLRTQHPDGVPMDELTIDGVVEWDMLCDKAEKVAALAKVMEGAPEGVPLPLGMGKN